MATINAEWLESNRPVWEACVPAEQVRSGGKMSDLNSVHEFAQFHPIAEVITQYRGYEIEGRLGASDRRFLTALVAADRDGFSVLVGVWDSGAKFVVRADGTEARIVE